jgi:hypothetical protein
MSLRQFTDQAGSRWEVWDVRPTSLTRPFPPVQEADPAQTITSLGPVRDSYAGGWLCFVRGDEKRRLAPIPPEWHLATEVELDALCREATEVAPSRISALEAFPPRLRLQPASPPAARQIPRS